jgi:hypothetical protein
MNQRKRPPSTPKRSASEQLPTRKISEALLEFAEPLLAHAPDHLSPQKLEHVLIVPITIWNAVILDDRGAMPGFLAQARARVALARPPPPSSTLWSSASALVLATIIASSVVIPFGLTTMAPFTFRPTHACLRLTVHAIPNPYKCPLSP